MARLPAIDATLRTVERIASAPTAPYHEFRAMRAIAGALGEIGITPEADAYGQLHARVRVGDARRSLALVAHTDHPASESASASDPPGPPPDRGGSSDASSTGWP